MLMWHLRRWILMKTHKKPWNQVISKPTRKIVMNTCVAGGGRLPIAVVERNSGSGSSSERCFSTCPKRTGPVAERPPAQWGGDLGQGFWDLPVHSAGSWHKTTTATSASEVLNRIWIKYYWVVVVQWWRLWVHRQAAMFRSFTNNLLLFR